MLGLCIAFFFFSFTSLPPRLALTYHFQRVSYIDTPRSNICIAHTCGAASSCILHILYIPTSVHVPSSAPPFSFVTASHIRQPASTFARFNAARGHVWRSYPFVPLWVAPQWCRSRSRRRRRRRPYTFPAKAEGRFRFAIARIVIILFPTTYPPIPLPYSPFPPLQAISSGRRCRRRA